MNIIKYGVPWCIAMSAALYSIQGAKRQSVPAHMPSSEEVTEADGEQNPFAMTIPLSPMQRGAVYDGLPSGWGDILGQLRSQGLVTKIDPWQIVGQDGEMDKMRHKFMDIAPQIPASAPASPARGADKPLRHQPPWRQLRRPQRSSIIHR